MLTLVLTLVLTLEAYSLQILIDPILETSDEETEEVQVNNNQLSVSPTHKSTANKVTYVTQTGVIYYYVMVKCFV